MTFPYQKWCSLLPLLLVILMGISGCGATRGETTRQTVHLTNLSLPESLVRIKVESVLSTPDAAELHASGVYKWGTFNEADLINLRGSLEDTLKAAIGQKQLDKSENVEIYVVIRKYIVAASNVEGAALAAVDWCAARQDGRLLYREVFYATDRVKFIGTLGGVKDTVHRAIVGRIAESALLIASRNSSALALPRNTEGTFDRHEEALKTLPENVASRGLFFITSIPYFIPGSSPVTVPWQSAGTSGTLSCAESLGQN